MLPESLLTKTRDDLLDLLVISEQERVQQAQALVRQKETIEALLEALRLQRYRQFGTKAETYVPEQLSLFDEAHWPEHQPEIEEAEATISVAAHARSQQPGRKPLPKSLPRQQRFYDLAAHEQVCACGHHLTPIGQVITEQLDIIPMQVYVIEHIRQKYACSHCEATVKQATMPIPPIPKSIAGPGLLSHVITAKFEDHLPLYRQERQLQRIGVDIPRATLSLWVIKCAQLLIPLKKLMQAHLQAYDIAYADESPVQVLKESGRPAQAKSYMWVFGGGPADKFCVLYEYDTSRSHEVPLGYLEDFEGYLHCDGYTGYDVLASKRPIQLVGCWYHARRKFFEANKLSRKPGLAHVALKYIQDLAKIEQSITEQALTPEEGRVYRQENSAPLLARFKTWLEDNLTRAPPKSLLGDAMRYTRHQWPKLCRYLEDGRLENNNNRLERAIKPFATGRKNWYFANSVEGAHAAATLYSFVQTCHYQGIQAFHYFYYVLQKLPACKTLDELEALLPYNIDKTLLTLPGADLHRPAPA